VDQKLRKRAQTTAGSEGIALDLTPLLSPYGRDRRIALRIERMPSRARLSRGRNNGDGSWSLTRDEVEDLFFVPAEGGNETPVLVVRIIGLGSDNGATLAVVDHAVAPQTGSDDSVDEDREAAEQHEAELRQLRSELTKTRASLRASQSELAAARNTFEAELEERLTEATADTAAALEKNQAALHAETRQRLAKADARAQERIKQEHERWQREAEAELSKAEETWKAAEAGRFAAAEVQWLDRARRQQAREAAEIEKAQAALAAVRAEAAGHAGADGELHRLRDQIATLQSTLSAHETGLAEAQADAARATERSQRETAAAVSKAEALWKAAETDRLAGAEAKWREQSAAALKDSNTHAEKAEAALTAAAEAWKAGEAARIAAAEAGTHETYKRTLSAMTAKLAQSEAALAAAQSARESSDGKRAGAEARRLKDALQAMQVALSARESELAEARSAVKETSDRARHESQSALEEAHKQWESAEAARFAEAKAKWQEQSDRVFKKATIRLEGAEAALAEARAEASTARDSRDSAEIRRLRSEFAATRARLAERESELAEAQVAAGRARERTREETEAALSKAQEAWKAGESMRIAEIETQERERGARALDEAVSRLERTEAALVEATAQLEAQRERSALALAEAGARVERKETQLNEARLQMEALRDPANEAEIGRLRSDLAAMQVSEAERGAELAQARTDARKARERWGVRIQAELQRAEEIWRTEETQRLEAARRDWERQTRLADAMSRAPMAPTKPPRERIPRRLAVDIALAMGLAVAVVAGVTFYPQLAELWPAVATASGTTTAALSESSPREVPKRAQATVPRAIVSVSSANVRAQPATKSVIIATVSRGTELTPTDRHGSWIRVRIGGDTGKPSRDGWVFGTSLKQIAAR